MTNERLIRQQNDLDKVPFEKVPIIGSLARQFARHLDTEIGLKGLEQAARDLIESRGGSINVFFESTDTGNVLSQKSVLVIAEHPYLFNDTFPITAALPRRANEDTYVIGLADNAGIGPNFRQHLVPLYINDRPNQNASSRRIWHNVGYNPPLFDQKEAAFHNIENLRFASELLRKGKRVIIFPDGVFFNNQWSSAGVGRIITEVGEDSKSYVVFAISDIGNGDLLQLLPIFRDVVPYRALVRFSNPLETQTLLEQLNFNKISITEYLQTRYIQWKVLQNTPTG